MKVCPNCKTQLADDAGFCTNCGTNLQQPPQNFNEAPQQNVNAQPQQNNAYAQPQPNAYPAPVPVVKPTDHTAEFTAEDVSANKLFALLVYAMSIIGVFLALVARIGGKSDYLNFHIKQGLKLVVAEVIVGFVTAVLSWTCIVPIAGAICIGILLVLDVICFIQTCRGKSVEVPILSSFGFLK